MGKGLGNGYPISGVLVRSSLADIVEASGFRYVQSHIDDPLGCIIARKVIEVIVEGNLIEHGAEMGEYFRRKLSHISERTGAIKEIRERGVMNVVILDKTYRAKKIFKSLLRMGFFIGYSEIFNLLHFYAPLIISIEKIDALCHSFEYILTRQ